MREKDIKKIFDNCYGSSEKAGKAEVSSERVKAAVMEKIGMSAAESFYTDSQEEELIKPVFAVVPKKKSSSAALKIAAWVGAAACLGAVVLSMGLFGENGLKTLLQQNGGDNNNAPAVSNTTSGQHINMELFGEDKNLSLLLMDGMYFIYTVDEEFSYDHSKIDQYDVVPFLYEKDGRLYFDPTDDGKVAAEDITGKINKTDFYLYTYDNPHNPVDPTHYLLMGGDVSEGKYGYMEIFKVKNTTNTWGFVGGFSYEYVTGPKFCDPVDPDAQWLAKGIKWLNEFYNVSADVTDSNVGCCRKNVNFKYKDDYNYGDINPDLLPYSQLTLLDGSLEMWYNNFTDGSVFFGTNGTKELLYKENGRLIFDSGIGYKEDITDKIDSDSFYLYTYENPENPFNTTHYIIVGGDLSKNFCGYLEVYQTDEELWGERGSFHLGDEDDEAVHDLQWVHCAEEFLAEECGVKLVGVNTINDTINNNN